MVGPGPELGRAPDAPFQAGELGLLSPRSVYRYGRLNTDGGCAEHTRGSCYYSSRVRSVTHQLRGTRPAGRMR